MAKLLAANDADSTGRYSAFVEHGLMVPTKPVELPEDIRAAATVHEHSTAARTERVGHLHPRRLDRTTFAAGDPFARDMPDISFMRDQLAGYTSDEPSSGAGAPYETIELTAQRVDTRTGATAHVHVFEMYWGDLSRVGTGMLSILGALYQLVFHIAHLGRKSLDVPAQAACAADERSPDAIAWRRAADAQAWVVRLFTIGVPIATLLLVGHLVLMVPAAVAESAQLVIATVIFVVAMLIALGGHAYFRGRGAHPASRLVRAMFVLIAGGIAVNLFTAANSSVGAYALAGVATALVVLAYLLVIDHYDRNVPGALPWGLIALAASVLATIVRVATNPPSSVFGVAETLRLDVLLGFQFSYAILLLVWLLIWAVATIVLVRMRRLAARSRKASFETLDRTRRALWTSVVTVTVSIFGFILTALVGYESLLVLAWRVHGTVNLFPRVTATETFPLSWSRIVPGWTCDTRPSQWPFDVSGCARSFFDALIAQGGTSGFLLALAAAAIAMIMISWFVALVAVTSVHTPSSPSRYAGTLGLWMSDGFVWLRRAGLVLVGGLCVALLIGIVASVVTSATGHALPYVNSATGTPILRWAAGVLLASAATFGAGRLRLQALATHAGPALGIILDVDNYLRESPSTRTPRARMAERYTSLLRSIVTRTDDDGRRSFDRVVIVSHSQGTIISADLLRFLTVTRIADPDLTQVDLRLLTMGCPLRQLYAANFPYLYRWIDRTDFNEPASEDRAATEYLGADFALVPPREGAGEDRDLSQHSPSPIWLRVRRWVNLYTTGDYVGRTLWRQPNDKAWEYESASAAAEGQGRRERCLGDGTHTRYWTSTDVGNEVDALLAG
ncbi:MAG TPA: hypothetical protein VN706_05545 [Gemmatimonadaceae bacterium]|nr:hypothetical protein [Gemmatimonadaceae bacterium]